MPVKYLLDTHTWIWWHSRPEKLSPKVKSIIAKPDKVDNILLSVISPWEFCKLLEKGRLSISIDTLEWLEQALDMTGLKLIPLSISISYKSTILPPPFHNDPADQIIVATAREYNAIILTKDERILNYQHVHSLW